MIMPGTWAMDVADNDVDAADAADEHYELWPWILLSFLFQFKLFRFFDSAVKNERKECHK